MEEDNVYLGDGVYASFDGFQIWLAVGDHTNNIVALEPAVMKELIKYKESIDKKLEDKYKNDTMNLIDKSELI